MSGRGRKNRSKKSQRQEQQQRREEQQRTEPEEVQQSGGPSGARQLEVPVTPSQKKTTSPKKRLPVRDTPTPHARLQRDEDVMKVLTGVGHKLPREVQQQVQEVMRHGKPADIFQLHKLTIGGATQSPEKQQMIEKGRQRAESIIESRLQNQKARLDQAEKLVTILNGAWYDGSLDLGKDEFQSKIDDLERVITALRGDVVVIQTSRHELSGRLMDNMIWEQDRQNADWAYLDLLISRYKTPEGAKLSLFASRDTDAQERFRTNVFNAYNAYHAVNDDMRWCVITGKYLYKKLVKAAHIVGYNVGEVSARHLFGPPNDKDGHLMAEKNGIPMFEGFEEAFDNAKLVIIPDGDPRKGCWKVHCLDDPDTHKSSGEVPFGRELHGRSLQFQNDFRPSARYLYFAFCMNILRRQRHEVPGWWRDYLVDDKRNEIWATPGNYLRTTTLRRLAHQVGHMTKEEAAEFAGPADADEEEEDVEMEDAQVELLAYRGQDSPTPATHKGERFPRDE